MGHISSWLVEALSGDMTPEECDQTDGTAGSPDVTTRISYTGAHQVDRIVNIAQSTGDADATTTEVHDSLGRLHSVTEQSGASGAPTTTTYDYDLGDRLIAVATGSQSRAFTYDGRGFLISETHPEKGASGNGTTLYQTTSGTSVTDGYDARGHARRRIDGTVDGPFDVKYTYDTAERLSKVEDPDPASNTPPKARRTLKQFTFATANAPSGCTDTSAGACDARNGKLLTGVRHNYLPATGDLAVTDTWQYTGLGGRTSQRDTTGGSGTRLSGGTFPAPPNLEDPRPLSVLQ